MNLLFLLLMLANTDTFSLSSPAFKHDEFIPKEYTCEGGDFNPPLLINGIPEGTQTLALIIDDVDAIDGTFIHWIVWNISPIKGIDENSNPGTEGKNGSGTNGYLGPCPPTGNHRYYFTLYALDIVLDVPVTAGKETLEQAMKDHILGKTELIGHYQKAIR